MGKLTAPLGRFCGWCRSILNRPIRDRGGREGPLALRGCSIASIIFIQSTLGDSASTQVFFYLAFTSRVVVVEETDDLSRYAMHGTYCAFSKRDWELRPESKQLSETAKNCGIAGVLSNHFPSSRLSRPLMRMLMITGGFWVHVGRHPLLRENISRQPFRTVFAWTALAETIALQPCRTSNIFYSGHHFCTTCRGDRGASPAQLNGISLLLR